GSLRGSPLSTRRFAGATLTSGRLDCGPRRSLCPGFKVDPRRPGAHRLSAWRRSSRGHFCPQNALLPAYGWNRCQTLHPMIKLLGLLLIAVGFALRANALLVVVAAGILTGLLSGMSINEVVGKLGTLFVENRYMTLPVVLIAPVIGLLENHGLRERAELLV